MFPMSAQGQQYFTMIYGILDTQQRRFRYACAGHPAPIYVSRDHPPVLCEARNTPIGMFEEESYEESVLDLEPGDRIYLYSDGVLEAMNRQREIFDEPRLLSAIEMGRAQSLKESVYSLLHAVDSWTGGDQVHDDLSILTVELTVDR